ncbi:hypothetical protein BaRGS_00011274, partial [Batillaria attramentaria]
MNGVSAPRHEPSQPIHVSGSIVWGFNISLEDVLFISQFTKKEKPRNTFTTGFHDTGKAYSRGENMAWTSWLTSVWVMFAVLVCT